MEFQESATYVTSLLDGGANFFKKEAKNDEFGGQCSQGNYGLRENPKKTWRAVDQNFPLPQEKVCKQCGKVFQSMKALCGHMACHSEKERGGGNRDDNNSWTSENQKLVCDSNSDDETETEERRKLRKSRCKRYKRIVIKNGSFSLANNYASSSVSGIDEIEKEEVAVCLMMLSRDAISKGGGITSVVESSDNNSVVVETKSLSSTEMRIVKREGVVMEKIGDVKLKKNDSSEMDKQENSDSGYFLGDAAKGESEVSVDEIRRSAAYWEYANSTKRQKVRGYGTELRKESTKENGFGNGAKDLNLEKKESKKRKKTDNCNDDDELVADNAVEISNPPCKKSKYECLNCKKIFKSYQALGGHRPCHKKINSYSQPKYENGEHSLDADNVGDQQPFRTKKGKSEKKVNKSKKQKGHVCPFCPRIFKSGQALGGHKRSHFLVSAGGGNEEPRNDQSPEIEKPEVHDLFDLNLPASVEDDDESGNVQFSTW
ncbi:C2H2 zinc finger transcription factor [Lithospermum erythrorhizon]|uniref:C2H2 zinc finger transcription factor n=1 Tax=Lithospermum erythrorhizon TaxID=34254 RepID=A0AAV3PDR4_LITER